MLEAGRYIIEKFYGNDYQKARENKRTADGSLRQLILLLQENSGDAPSKTWVYDAVNLAVDEHLLSDFRTYGNIGHSHKVLLTHVPDLKRKKSLVEETADKNYSVVRLRERIKATNPNARTNITLDKIPNDKTLAKLGKKKLGNLRNKLDKRILEYEKALEKYKADKERVEKLIDK